MVATVPVTTSTEAETTETTIMLVVMCLQDWTSPLRVFFKLWVAVAHASITETMQNLNRGDAEEQMGRNGDVAGMLSLIRNIVSGTCTEVPKNMLESLNQLQFQLPFIVIAVPLPYPTKLAFP